MTWTIIGTAPFRASPPGGYHFDWYVVDLAGAFSTPFVPIATCAAGFMTVPGADGSSCNPTTGIPSTVNTSQRFSSALNFHNNANTDWNLSYLIQEVDSTGNSTTNNWSASNNTLTTTITPNGDLSQTLNFIAPAVSGTYVFNFKVMAAGGALFGAICPAVTITVVAPAVPANRPVLTIVSSDCTAINFWTADPDVSGQPLNFRVAHSSPVLLANVIGGGIANLLSPPADPPFNGVSHGGSWVIQPADKDTNSHTYFILAAGKAANNVNDGFNTETPQATPITIGPCVTVPQPPILIIDRATCDDGIIISAQDLDSPGSGVGIYVSENSDMSNALGGGVANGSPAFASIPSHGLLFTGIKKDISPHTYFIKAYGVNGATPVALEGPDAADSVSIMNCITPSPGITTPPTPIPPPVDNAPTNQPDLFKQACIDNPAAAVCNDRDRNQTPTDNSFFGNDGIVAKVANTLSIIIGVASVLVAMVAGFKFIASAGDANQVASAKRTILFAVVGVVVAIFAQAIIIFVLKGL